NGAHACEAQPDSCQNARVLDLSSGSATVRGDTSKGVDDTRLSCSYASSAPDLVYTFTLDQPQRVTATATPAAGSYLIPVLAIRGDCASSLASATVACAYQLSPNDPQTVLSTELPAGKWFLWVDGDGDSAGEFLLTVKLDP